MKHGIRWAARLYPPQWRKRYGVEFEELLNQVDPKPGDVWDVMRGALKMQLAALRFGKLSLILGLAGAVVAAGIALRIPDRYSSTAVLHLQAPDSAAALESLMQLQVDTLGRKSLQKVILDENLFKAERQKTPIEDIVAEMRNRYIRISPSKSPESRGDFQVEFSYPDREKAQAVTRYLTASFLQNAPPQMLELRSQPTDPQLDRPSNRMIVILAGFAVGFACGLLLLGIRKWPIAFATGAGAAALAWSGTFLIPFRYISSAIVKTDGPIAREAIDRVLGAENLTRLIELPVLNLYQFERRRNTPMAAVVEQMRHNIRIAPASSGAISIAFAYLNRYKAQQVVRELLVDFGAIPGVRVLDAPSLPQKAAFPNRTDIAIGGLAVGLLIGMFVQRWRNRRLILRPAE